MLQTRKGDIREVEIIDCTGQATTNAYVDVTGSLIDTLWRESLALTIANTDGSDDLKWKVLGSVDAETFVEVQAEETLGEGVSDSFVANPVIYRYYKVQVKSATNDTPAAAKVDGIAK